MIPYQIVAPTIPASDTSIKYTLRRFDPRGDLVDMELGKQSV